MITYIGVPFIKYFKILYFIDTSCVSFPGPGDRHIYLFNPMQEFVHNHQKHVDDAFENFKYNHKKNYAHDLEHKQRKEHFRQNMRLYIYFLVVK